MTLRSRILKAHPATLILASFLLAIFLGMFMLKLPISTKAGHIQWIDALFTATSAVCVTGLAVVDTGSFFTLFGQWVILALIQVGGLGVMTISVSLFQWMGRSVSFRQRMVMQDLFAHTPRQDILGLVKSIFLFTLGAEILGSALLTIHWCREMPFTKCSIHGCLSFDFGILQRRLRAVPGQHGPLQRQPASEYHHLRPDCHRRYRVSGALRPSVLVRRIGNG